MSDQTPSVPTAQAAPKTRSSPWHVAFEAEILATVIGPKIKELLAGGVTSRSNLTDAFNEKHGCKVGPDKMTEWLKILNLDAIFSKPTFRLSDPSAVASLAAQTHTAGAVAGPTRSKRSRVSRRRRGAGLIATGYTTPYLPRATPEIRSTSSCSAQR